MSDVNEWLDRRRWVVDGGRKVLLPKANDDRKLLVAVEKVLELHKPSEYGCVSECQEPNGDLAHPCPTVRAVQSAIEGASNAE